MPIVSSPIKPEHLAFGDKPVWVSATDGDTPTPRANTMLRSSALLTAPAKTSIRAQQFLSKKLLNNAWPGISQPDMPSSNTSRSGSKTARTKRQERQTAHTPAYFCDGRGRSI